MVLPDGKRALITNEAPGTVSVLDIARRKVTKTVTVGGHLATLRR